MDAELLDWELLNGSDTESADSVTSEKKSASSSVIDDGRVLSDHFSADNLFKISSEITDQTQYGVMDSGDSSRVDYGSERVQVHVFDQLKVNQAGEDCVGNELGVYDSNNEVSGDGEAKLRDFEAVHEKHVEGEAIADGRHVESQSGVEEHVEDSSNSWSDSGGNELVSGDSEVVNGEEEIVSDSGVVSEGNGENSVEVVAVNSAVRSGDESKSKETVWWKTPFVLLKYCAFRIGPVWSVSMAAAVLGLVLLGRRLYNMKKKAQRFQLKVTIDDKKVARVMSQAARLNEVFTEVRRVPVIRPALPSPGAWPVLSLR